VPVVELDERHAAVQLLRGGGWRKISVIVPVRQSMRRPSAGSTICSMTTCVQCAETWITKRHTAREPAISMSHSHDRDGRSSCDVFPAAASARAKSNRSSWCVP
jgi:hypothetical protein